MNRSAKGDEVFPNSHQPFTHGFTKAMLRPYTSGISATWSATANRSASWNSSSRDRSLRSCLARSISSSNGG